MQRIILDEEQFSKLVSGEVLNFAPLQGEDITVCLERELSFSKMLNAIQEAIENGNIHDDATDDVNMVEAETVAEPEPAVMEEAEDWEFERLDEELESPPNPTQEP